MAAVRKYAHLDDIDNAPDIYETPDLTDDASTLQTSTARSQSPEADDLTNVSSSRIVRGRLDPDQARNRFVSSRVDASETDFSDRVSAKKQSYRVTSRRRRDGSLHTNGEAEDVISSDEDTDEGLDRRVARLTREIEEVKAAFAQRQAQQNADGIQQGGKDDKSSRRALETLSKALDTVRNSQRDAVSAHSRLAKQLSWPLNTGSVSQVSPPQTSQVPQPAPVDTDTLNRIAAFDARLSSLERSLGLSNLDLSSRSTTNIIPILPTVSLLDRQISLLTSASTLPNLDALKEKLSTLSQSSDPPSSSSASQADEDAAKLRSLYALLPTLNNLSPTVPALLFRLRSLRQIHASAASAGQMLEELERRQGDTEKEISAWKAGLQRVEEAVKDAESGIKANSDVVEGWVRDLEARLKSAGVE